MIDAETILRTLAAQVPGDPLPRLATVDPAHVSGLPRVTFDGESTLSTKLYPRLSSYTPVANDRVLMIPVGSSYVILGKVINT